MKKVKLLLYRCLHFVFRYFAAWDLQVEKQMELLQRPPVKAHGSGLVPREKKDPFFGGMRVITHAGGGIQGERYLNCTQAPEMFYNAGNRVFEFDVQLSADGHYVLSHDQVGVDRKKFLDQKIDHRFSPMPIEDALAFLAAHEDACVIFDCKTGNLDRFAAFLVCKCKVHSVRNRIVIQVFNEQDVQAVRTVYDFKLLHVCMYNADYEAIAARCLACGIGAVSVSEKAIRERSGWEVFEQSNICMFAYTVNSVDIYLDLWAKGITGVFSDFLHQSDVEGVLDDGPKS